MKPKMDVEAAKRWANSGTGKKVVASRKTTERHDSEWQGAIALPPNLNDVVRFSSEGKAVVAEFPTDHVKLHEQTSPLAAQIIADDLNKMLERIRNDRANA